ncbi:MAG TPA: hypothetical protein VHX37_09220 [Acidobacteriaceae bacterium]|jgi:hypothetical protein|nr:hypothetical protein [Acidobacteriaceae bacterium]
MKRILLWTVLIVGTLFITKYANDVAQDVRPRGATFRMVKQKVVTCGDGQVVLDGPEGPTTLRIDNSWPTCSTFLPNTDYDLWLARGGTTGYISSEKSPWWRTAM